MTLWYYVFHVATVLQELLLENVTQPCCSTTVKNADYHTQC